jgi:DnaJ-domain-containing protein 1
MRIYGKILGAALGWMLMRHPAGAVLGAVLGHVFDAGWLFPDKPGGQSGAKALELEAAYRTLGLDPAASNEEVERAFRKQISDYHPDKVAGAAKEIRELAETRAREINKAYEAIQKARKAAAGD